MIALVRFISPVKRAAILLVQSISTREARTAVAGGIERMVGGDTQSAIQRNDRTDPVGSSAVVRPVSLSLIIPAYNEAARLPSTLEQVASHLSRWSGSWEVIVADDGSFDDTGAVALSAAEQDERFRYLKLGHRGKAAAVASGVAAARGEVVVFTDADLSTPISYIDAVRALIPDQADVVIGSREVSGARRLGEPGYRHLMGRAFNYLAQALAVPGIRDTQCGFKGFSAEAARDIFSHTRLYRDGVREVSGPMVTGFDVELVFLARKRGWRIRELPVSWTHVAGSKVRPLADALLMIRDAGSVRLNDLRGNYADRATTTTDDVASEQASISDTW